MASDPAQQAWESFRARDRFGSLDGLRCLSILAVVWHHGPGQFQSGFAGRGHYGVPLFFAISGFLITTLLLRERERNGFVQLRRFYARRTLRIFPLYYATLAVFTAVAGIGLSPAREAEFYRNLPYFLTYTANWIGDTSVGFGYAWSLGAEEQFYATWPFFASRLRLPLAAGLMSVLFVAAVVTQYRLILPITITAGCLLALALHTRSGFEIGWRVLGWRAAPVALGLAALAGLTFLKEPWIAVVDVLFALLTAACVIREDHLLAPFLRLRAIAYIGTISYGIYLLHPLVYGALQLPLFGAIAFTVPGFFVSTALTLIAATLSFRYFEGPFLRWKHRFDVRR